MRETERTKPFAKTILSLLLLTTIVHMQYRAFASKDPGSHASIDSQSENKLTLWKFPLIDPRYKEGCVSLNEDRTLIAFQSQRPGGYGGYDIWLARFERGKWSDPINAGPGVNSPLHEIDVGLSADGESMFFTRSAFGGRSAVAAQGNIPNKQTDLYVSYSRDRDGHWSKAELIPSPISLPESSEFRAVLAQDGNRLYFGSDRKGGYGGYDLYYSERRGSTWGEPVNLGPRINTAADELDAAISVDENVLILPIQGDLFVSFRVKDEWTTPVNMGPRFNTPGSDGCPWLGYDGHTLYVNSTWEGLLAGQAGQGSLWVFECSKGFRNAVSKN